MKSDPQSDYKNIYIQNICYQTIFLLEKGSVPALNLPAQPLPRRERMQKPACLRGSDTHSVGWGGCPRKEGRREQWGEGEMRAGWRVHVLTANRCQCRGWDGSSPKRWLWPSRFRKIAGRLRSHSAKASHGSASSGALSRGLLRNEAEHLEAEPLTM